MKPSRRLRRFFSTQPLAAAGQGISLTKSETHHLRDLFRLKLGDRCLIVDGSGSEAEAKIREFLENGTALLEVQKILFHSPAQSIVRLRTVQALAKKGKIDYLVEKAQELGVDEFWPIETERSVVRMSQENQLKTLARWQKKAAEAAKQSGSLRLLRIIPPQTFQEAVATIPAAEEMVVFHPDQKALSFKEWVQQIQGKIKGGEKPVFNLFFGPEGGFSEKEITLVKSESQKTGRRWSMIHLGENILRIDTAFLGAVSSIKLLFL